MFCIMFAYKNIPRSVYLYIYSNPLFFQKKILIFENTKYTKGKYANHALAFSIMHTPKLHFRQHQLNLDRKKK